MQPADRALHHPAELAQAAAVRGVAARDDWLDLPPAQLLAMWIGIVAAVGQQVLGLTLGRADLPAHRWHRVHHRDQLLAVVLVGLGDLGDQRRALEVDQHVMLGARFPAIDRAGAGVGAPKKARRYEASAIIAASSSCPA